MTPMANGAQPQGPTKDKKKLKKLRKRVANQQCEGERSGLLTKAEWEQFQSLEEPDNYMHSLGPSVHRRKRKEGNKVEGTHHRDLLAWCLKHLATTTSDPPNKKRTRDQEDDPLQNPSIPAWASIHNPGTIESLVILEVHVPSNLEAYMSMATSIATTNRRSCLPLATKWFQGEIPRTLSGSLLYFVANKRKRPKSDAQPPPNSELLAELEQMILPQKDWQNEGYPTTEETNSESKKGADSIPALSSTLQDPSSTDLEKAEELVSSLGVRVNDQDDDDTQLYVCTRARPDDETASKEPRVFGMDCEMVQTTLGSELARITMVQLVGFEGDNFQTTTILDALVKPRNSVRDYVTEHSGITRDLLEPVTTRLEQVQAAMLQFLHPQDILVGHSLENDLRAAHYIHPRVVDTALVFRHRNKRTKFSLRHLSAALLNRIIQKGSHCSEVDARTTLELAARRAWLGEGYGLTGNDERRSLFELPTKETKTVCMGPPDWLKAHVTNHANGIHALNSESVAECKKAMLAWTKSPRKAQLAWAHLQLEESTAEPSDGPLRDMLQSLTETVSPTTLVLVALQEGFHHARKMNKQKQACTDRRATVGWSAEQDATFQQALDKSRAGKVVWIGAPNATSS